jgi:hypothetical protein
MEERPLNNAWVGFDVGKEFHWVHVLWTPREHNCSPAGLKTTRPTFWPSSRRSSPSQRKSSGRPTSPGAAQRCCWLFCGRRAKR